MMKWHAIALVALTAMAASAQAQVYKCKGPDGRTVMQQMPCADGRGGKVDVRPASGYATPVAAAPAASAAGDARPMTEAERINAATAASAQKRRANELNDIVVPRARRAMYAHRDRCEKDQQRLQQQQYVYVQNLYGKAHASQMASEMAASAARCDTKDRELTAEFQRLLDECKGLGACKDVAP